MSVANRLDANGTIAVGGATIVGGIYKFMIAHQSDAGAFLVWAGVITLVYGWIQKARAALYRKKTNPKP